MILVFDSYAWIEYFAGSEKGLKVKDLMLKADLIYTPSVILLEIANKYFREKFDVSVVNERLKIIRRISIVDPIRDDVLVILKDAQKLLDKNARRLGIKRKPSIIDYYLLALAKKIDAKVVTGDEHFRGLSRVIFLE